MGQNGRFLEVRLDDTQLGPGGGPGGISALLLASDPDTPPAPVLAGAQVQALADLNGRQIVYLGTSLEPQFDSVTLGADPNVVGLDTFFSDDVDDTVVAAKVDPGCLYGLQLYNPDVAAIFLQIFDLAAGDVVLGTTVPKKIIGVAAGAMKEIAWVIPLNFAVAISLAGTTTPTGNTAPGAALIVSGDIK